MADMSMKLENIIKSLRYCCGDLDVTRVCHKCPYHMPEDADRMCIDELMSEAVNAIEELSGFVQEAERDRDEYKERLDKTNDLMQKQWIPVTERLPEDLQNVLVIDDGRVTIGHCEHYYGDEQIYVEWHDTLYYPIDPPCWMPLPEPPKEE